MTTFNARERPLADWVKLCCDADSRLKLRFVSRPEGGMLSVTSGGKINRNGLTSIPVEECSRRQYHSNLRNREIHTVTSGKQGRSNSYRFPYNLNTRITQQAEYDH